MSIHSRRASKAVLDSLSAHSDAGIPVLHWFSGSARDLDRAIDLGCWFSVGPAMLNGAKGRGLTTRMPRERVLTESDGPFAQIEGRSVLPWQVDSAVAGLADLWHITGQETQNILDANLRRLTEYQFPACGS